MKNYLATALFALLNSPGEGADQGFTKTFPGAVTISANGARQNMVSYQLDTAAITWISTPRSTAVPISGRTSGIQRANEQLWRRVRSKRRGRCERHHQVGDQQLSS